MEMEPETQKSARVVVRVHPDDKRDMDRAARLERRRPAEWVRALLLAEARRVLAEHGERKAA